MCQPHDVNKGNTPEIPDELVVYVGVVPRETKNEHCRDATHQPHQKTPLYDGPVEPKMVNEKNAGPKSCSKPLLTVRIARSGTAAPGTWRPSLLPAQSGNTEAVDAKLPLPNGGAHGRAFVDVCHVHFGSVF